LTRFIADENIPRETVELLKRKGVDIVSVSDVSPGLGDDEILELARKDERIVITFDRDFSQLIFKQKRKTKGLILLRFNPESPQQIAKRIQQALATKIKMDSSVIVVKKDTLKVTSTRK
jgi:predicted nuclease of predicted toxin-antitoxin system